MVQAPRITKELRSFCNYPPAARIIFSHESSKNSSPIWMARICRPTIWNSLNKKTLTRMQERRRWFMDSLAWSQWGHPSGRKCLLIHVTWLLTVKKQFKCLVVKFRGKYNKEGQNFPQRKKRMKTKSKSWELIENYRRAKIDKPATSLASYLIQWSWI
jgi:hypothetical protein